jgi:hypothetical protein
MAAADAQLAMPAVAASALAGCGAWYRANPARAIGEAAHGHAALALPGAIVVTLGALGLGSGMDIAAPDGSPVTRIDYVLER